MKALVLVLLIGCGPRIIHGSTPEPLPVHAERAIDTSPKARKRVLPPEVYLRNYLAWFGGLAPLAVQQQAHGKQLFDTWDDYLAALGLPDYRIDLPRVAQSNTLMLATLGRLGEALCIRAAQHDLRARTLEERVVFAFVPKDPVDDAALRERIDVLHRMFLGYPLALAAPARGERLVALFRAISGRHQGQKQPLSATETAWAGVCTALVQHPEVELY